jgi:PAS domain S-box-containing protein
LLVDGYHIVNLRSYPLSHQLGNPQPTILCVDDEVRGLQVRKLVLESAGYSVLLAENGPAALRVFASNSVDCVVLDYMMPGMDGGMVAANMRSLKPRVPIVLLSAYVSLPDTTLGLVDAYVTKGQSPMVLLERLRGILQTGGHRHPELEGNIVAFVNAKRQYVEVTDGYCELLGYTRDELLSKTIDDVVASAPVEELFADYVRTRQQRGTVILRRRDGGKVRVRYSAVAYPDGCLVSRMEPIANEESGEEPVAPLDERRCG